MKHVSKDVNPLMFNDMNYDQLYSILGSIDHD